MKEQEVLKKIGGIISEISEQYQYLQSEHNHVNSLELELFVANAHFLTDHAEILRKIIGSKPAGETPDAIAADIMPAEPVVADNPVFSAAQTGNYGEYFPETDMEETAAMPEPEPVPAPVATPEPTVSVSEEPIAPEPAANSEPEPVPVPPGETAPQQVIDPDPIPQIDLEGQKDTYNYVRQAPEPAGEHKPFAISSHTAAEPIAPEQQAPLTLNQRLAAQSQGGNTATQPAATKPVGDLKGTISLNDKLLFVRDLFNGYNLAYSEALELLNRCKTFDEADKFLKANYAAKNNWANKQATADKFYTLLSKKYPQ